MTGFLPYSDYKDAGVDWLGRVPSHWSIRPLGTFFDERRETVSDKDFTPLSVTMKGIVPQLETAAKTDNGDNRKRVNVGDFVINSRSDRKGSAGISNLPGSVSVISTVLTQRSGLNSRFIHYLLRSQPFQEEYYRFGTGIVADLWSTRYSSMKRITLAVPPPGEQSTIARFLDHETQQIDDLIGKQERLIELLAEKRQAIITHAVTKGLAPNAPTKPSGVPWLGEVPETWRTAELKRALTFITSGSRGWAEYYADHGKPFVRIGNLTRGHLHLDMAETQHVEVPPDAEGTRAVVEAGDVLFSITAYLGSVAVASEKESGSYVSQHVAITQLDQNRLHPRFLAYFVLSEFGQRQLNEGAYGGTKLQLSLEDIKKLMIPVPGISEQIQIARHLDTSAARIDTLIGLSRKSVSLLRERRSALISAAVTGKIDVTNEGVAA